MIFDAIVVGLGAMGSATLYQLSKQTPNVLGLDQFDPPHTLGSTHGDSRITRQAIGEGPYFVPLALRSYEIWQELEERTGQELFVRTGGLFVGKEQSQVHTHNKPGWLNTTIRAAEGFGIAHEVLDRKMLQERFPQFRLQADDIGYYEFNAGYLKPERCISVQLAQAQQHGASIRANERMLSFTETATSVRVKTTLGEYSAKRLILTTGSWVAGSLVATPYQQLVTVYRQVQYWFDVQEYHTSFTPDRFPVFILSDRDVYGFPAIDGPGGGLKIAMETYLNPTTPDTVSRVVSEAETRRMYDHYVAPNFSGIGRGCIKSAVCLYTMTPNGDFLLDYHPAHTQVLLASACSGHGFKHSAAVGQILAELALQDRTDFDIAPFRLSRFARYR